MEPEANKDALQSQSGGGAGAGRANTEEIFDFDVEATDGSVGEVEDVERTAGKSYLIVRTGGTIFSKKVLIPAGLVERVDRDAKKVYVDRTTDEIKNAPEFDEERYREESYHDELSTHYGRTPPNPGL